MLNSMTGYGKSSGVYNGKTISIEIKSLNSKSLDLYVKTPNQYRDKELNIRKLVGELLERGKIDLSVNIENTIASKNTEINQELALSYYEDLKKINQLTNNSSVDFLSLILKMPDIFIQTSELISDEEIDFLMSLIKEATVNLIEFRKQEGKALQIEFKQRIEEIRSLLKAIEPFENIRIETVKEKIRKGLEELENSAIDENRLHQELIYYLEKLDVSEEKMRLNNHLDYFLETMEIPASGRKLGFITQEIGREINTLGSKSNHAEMQKIVVNMKDNLEKIKEQILNTL
jgi:uncharacterized protein (TIGR00255 family)